MFRPALLAALALALSLVPTSARAVEKPKYEVTYSVQFLPATGSAAVEIRTKRGTGRLISLDLDMPSATFSSVGGDGTVQRTGDRVLWQPPREGGALRYQVAVDHRRSNGEYDSRMTPDWVITRGDRLFAAAKIGATKGSGSTARLEFKLPAGWDDAETPFSKVSGGAFAVTNAERRYDRPVGWIAAGNLSTSRETIADTKIALVAPKKVRLDAAVTMALLRQALPEMRKAFGELPRKILIVRSGDPMWRGGLSAPGSLWLHADRPLLSANGTSPLLHELMHVVTNIRGDGDDDWIAEGIAEFYSLEIGRRSGLISEDRFQKAIKAADQSGAKIATLRATTSERDRTRKAVALFAALDKELRVDAGADLDALTRLLMRRETVTLKELRADAEKLEGHASRVLAKVE